MRLTAHILDGLLARWCRLMHGSIRYAGGREYECKTCRRRHVVPWALPDAEHDEKVGAVGVVAVEEQ